MKSTASKPVPSPGRADKYPPPLMRFLRGNVGSRSRGRSGSRATALFLRRKRTTSSSSTAIDAHQQEPSSPKVTCIGQVRVRRSSAQSKNPAPKKLAHRRRPDPGNSSRFCYSFHFDLCPRRRHWRKFTSFFHCTKIRVRTDSSKKGSVEIENEDRERASAGVGESLGRAIGSGKPPTPPKNAFLLTRSISAPHRSSYLSNRFWGSPLKTEDCKTGEQENRGSNPGKEDPVGPLEIEKIPIDTDAESRTDPELVVNAEVCREDSEEGEADEEGEEQSETEREGTVNGPGKGPVVLTRSKSEPASMWRVRERRMESTFSSSSSTNSVDNK